MRAQLLIATTLASGLITLGVACGTDTVYVYEDAGATNGTSSGSSGKSSSGSSGKSSSGSSGNSSSGTTGDDDDTTSSSSSSGSTSGSTSSSGGHDAGSDGGSSSGFPVLPSTKLVDGDNSVLLAIVGDDALFRTFPAASGDPSDIFVVPLAGGTPEKLWSIGATDSQSISGVVIAHWSNVANGVGNLDVWSRASGLKTGIATNSVAGLIRGSADGSRIAFGQDATLAGNKPNSTAIGVRGISDTTNIVTLSGATGQVNLASSACAPQLSFAGQTFFAEFCNGTVATQNLARLVALPAGSTTLKRIDAADDASANTLAGNVRFSTDATGAKIVAASLGGTNNTGKVYTVANPGTGVIDLEGFPTALGGTLYTMTPDGTHVLYRLAPNATTAGDLKAAVVTASPATIKTISAGVLAITNVSLDGHSLMFRKLAPASNLVDINLVDFSVAAPAPTAILADAKGLPLGFTGNSAQAVYIDGTPLPAAPPILKSKPVAGGAGKDLVMNAVGGRAPSVGTGFLFFTNVQNGTSSFPTVADINYVDAATGSAPKKISSGVPIASNDTEFFLSGKKVVYTRLLPAGEEGIYTITLP